ncbi:hypothetical protein ACA910_020080 [Epithemia clementina (nom. ined.)]
MEKSCKGSKEGKADKATAQTRTSTDRPAWMEIGPQAGKPDTKHTDGKHYYWCKFHGRWSLNKEHTTDKCDGRGLRGEKKELHTKEKGNDGATTPGLRLASALASIAPDDDDSTDK